MTTIVTADWHASANPRDAYRWEFIERTLPRMVAEHEAQRVLVLGDFTESKDRHAAPLVNRLVDALAKIAEVADVYALRGNHDYFAEDAPFFRFLRHVPRVRWINEPTPLKLKGLGDCLFLPHTRLVEDWVDHMFDSYDYFFCHQTFNGADMGGHKAEGGPFEPHIFTGKKFSCISGDVHVPQRVGPVTYVGAPYTVDFGDDFEPRVLVLGGGKARSVPVPGPQKRLVTLSGRDPLAALDKKNSSLREGDVVKVRVELPPRSDLSRAAVRAHVREWAARAGVLLHTAQVVAPAAAAADASAPRERLSDEELVRAYVRRMKRDAVTERAGLTIMEEVE